MGERVSRQKRKRARSALFYSFTFALALVVGALGHTNLPAPRRWVQDVVNAALAPLPSARVAIGEITRLTPTGATVRTIDVDVPGVGRLHAEDVRATVKPWITLWDLCWRRAVVRVHLPTSEAAFIDLESRPGERTPSESSEGGRSVHLEADQVLVLRALIHGSTKDSGPPDPALDVTLENLHASGGVDPHELRAAAKTRATVRGVLALPVRLDVDGNMTMLLATPAGAPVHLSNARARARVEAGDVHLAAVGAMKEDRLDLELDLPVTSAEAMRAIWPAIPLLDDVSLRATLEGALPSPQVHLEAAVGKGTVRADGDLEWSTDPKLSVRTAVRDVDLKAFSRRLPTTRLGLDGDLRLGLAPASLVRDSPRFPVVGAAEVSVLPSVIADIAVPHANVHVAIAPHVARVVAKVHEPGAPTSLELDVDPTGALEAEAELVAPSLGQVKRLRDVLHLAHLGGHASARAQATLRQGELWVMATLDARDVAVPRGSARGLHLAGTARGPFDKLALNLDGRLSGVFAGAWSSDDVFVSIHGEPDALDLSLAGRGGSADVVALATRVAPGWPMNLSELSLRWERAGRSCVLSARSARISGDALDVDSLRVDGLGDPIDAEIHLARSQVKLSVSAPSIDLARASALFANARWRGLGTLQLSSNESGRALSMEGRLRLRGASFNGAGRTPGADPGREPSRAFELPLDLDASLNLHDGAAEVSVVIGGQGLGGARLTARGELPPAASLGAALRALTGTVEVSTDRLPIDRLCAALGCSGVLARVASGLNGATAALYVEVARRAPSGQNDTTVRLSADAADATGPLAHVELDTQFDVRRMFSTGRLPDDAPFDLEFGMDRRALDRLPAGFTIAGLTGAVEVHGYARGTLNKPFIVVEATGQGVHYVGLPQRSGAQFGFHWLTTCDIQGLASEVEVRSGEKQVLRGSLRIDTSPAELVSGAGHWKGNATLALHGFPLSFVPWLADHAVRGAVSGEVSVSDLHAVPDVHGELTVDNLRVGRESAGPIQFMFEARDHVCTGSLRAGDERAQKGAPYGYASASAGCFFRDGLVPQLDPAVPVELALDAQRFPLAALQPIADDVIERLSGTLDAHLAVSAPPRFPDLWWAIRGEAKLSDGRMLPLVVGREVRQLAAELTADGSGEVRVTKIAGEVGAGTFVGTMLFRLADQRLQHAKAELHVPSGRAIPFTLQGVSYGTLSGDVFAEGNLQGDRFVISLRAPSLRAELPPQRSGILEPLDGDPAVVVLEPLGPPEERVATGGGPPEHPSRDVTVVLELELGDHVYLSRDDMRVEVTTPPAPQNPRLTLGREPTIDGTVQIRGGRVPVAGRVFRIDRGVVRFSGDDPSDPSLDVDAIYEGSDASGTRINVHVGGSAKDIKLTLSSSPPKSESELLAILAFGEPAPSSSTGGLTSQTGATQAVTPGVAAESAAVGVGTAVLTSGLNQILSQSVIPIRTSISAGQSTQASASLQLSEQFRLEYIRQFGATLYGQPQDVNRFAFDWRFKPRWMLRTQVGDRGTTNVDILWQRWY